MIVLKRGNVVRTQIKRIKINIILKLKKKIEKIGKDQPRKIIKQLI